MVRHSLIAALTLALATSQVDAEALLSLKGHGGPVKAIQVDGNRVLTASFDNSVGIWDAQTGEVSWREGHAAAVNAVSPLENGGLVSAGDDFDLLVWNDDGSVAHHLSGHTAKIMNTDTYGAIVATASWDWRIGLWNAESGEHLHWLEGHKGPVNDIAFSTDGTTLYSASYDGAVLAWNWRENRIDRALARHGFGINVIALDDPRGWLAYGALDGGTRVVHLATGGQIADLSAGRRPILAMARRPDGGEIAIGDGEGFVMVVETEGWTIRRDFKAATRGPVWALDYAQDASAVWAAGIDDAAYRFEIEEKDQPLMAETDRSFLRAPETMTNGERQFMRKCSVCHTLSGDGARRAGPPLEGLFGRKAGTVAGYIYSQTLENSDLIWTEKTVAELFDVGPIHYLPGTKMPMQRIVRAEDRADLVGFLRQNTGGRELMKPMMLAFVAIAVIAIGANQMLMKQGFSSQDSYSGDAVRLE